MLFRDQAARPTDIQMIEDFFIESNSQLVDPTLRRFDSVWRSKVVEGELPSREDIDPVEVAEMLPHIMLADVIEGDRGIAIEPRLVGQHHLALSGSVPGRSVMGDGLADGVLAHVAIDAIAERQQPYYAMLRIEGVGHQPFEAARAVYPLSSDGVTIDRIVSVVVPYDPAGKGPFDALMRR